MQTVYNPTTMDTGHDEATDDAYLESLKGRFLEFGAAAEQLAEQIRSVNPEQVDPLILFMAANPFQAEHERDIFLLKGEIIRQSTQVTSVQSLNLDPNALFEPEVYTEAVLTWLRELTLSGLERVKVNNSLHLPKGRILTFADPDFMRKLISDTCYIQNYGFRAFDYKPLVDSQEEMEVRFSEGGTSTYSDFLGMTLATLRTLNRTPESRKQALFRATGRDGIIGQLMRCGGGVTSFLSTPQCVNPQTHAFTEEAPIMFSDGNPDSGDITLDLERLAARFPNLVNVNNPATVRVKGGAICPASQGLYLDNGGDFAEEEMIILWFMKRAIELTPESYFES
jgi:hypothetical protein